MTLVHLNARLMLSSASDFISFLHVHILFCLSTFDVNINMFIGHSEYLLVPPCCCFCFVSHCLACLDLKQEVS